MRQQRIARTDTGKHQELWRVEGTARQDDLLRSADLLPLPLALARFRMRSVQAIALEILDAACGGCRRRSECVGSECVGSQRGEARAVLDDSESGGRAAVLDVRVDHDPQRSLLQVLELREHERLRLEQPEVKTIGRFRYLEALPDSAASSAPGGPEPAMRGSAGSLKGTLVLIHGFPLSARMWEPQLALADHGWRDIVVRSNAAVWSRPLVEISSADTFHFEPHFGWKGHIEQTSPLAVHADQIGEAVRQR